MCADIQRVVRKFRVKMQNTPFPRDSKTTKRHSFRICSVHRHFAKSVKFFNRQKNEKTA